jgi:hypothetical protein
MAHKSRVRTLEDLYIAAMFAAGAAVFTLAFFVGGVNDPFALVTIVALTFVAERLQVRLYFDGTVSVSFVGIVIAALLFGPIGAALAATSVAMSSYLAAGRPARKLVFNFGLHNVAAGLMSAVLVATSKLNGWGEPVALLVGGTAAATLQYTFESVAVSIILSITSGRSIKTSFRENFAWLAPHYVVLGFVGGCLVATYTEIGIAAILVLTLPLLLSRYSFQQFVGKTKDNVLRLEKSNDQLQHAYVEIRDMSVQLRDAYTGTLESLVTALDVRDQETRGHSMRVAAHSVDIAKMLGITGEEELAYVYRGALMHDVGKIGVPDAILLKPAKLTDEEWEFMRRHSAMGYRILAQVPYLRPAAKIVLAHHERWDGDGYPRRLKGEDIPLGARIFALCDTYDAIISDRPYRQGQTPDAAFTEILRCAGTQFDPTVIEAFEASFPQWRQETPEGVRKPLYLPSWIANEEGRDTRAAG